MYDKKSTRILIRINSFNGLLNGLSSIMKLLLEVEVVLNHLKPIMVAKPMKSPISGDGMVRIALTPPVNKNPYTEKDRLFRVRFVADDLQLFNCDGRYDEKPTETKNQSVIEKEATESGCGENK